jgi:hypothetical protein
MTPKIIELIIQDNDDEAGLDGIALVELPAHESNFEYFSHSKEEGCGDKCNHYVLSDEQIPQIIQMFHAYGEPQGLLEKEGFKITKVKPVGKKEFAIISDPNAPSSQDTPDVKFRYKYIGPQDNKNRTFCAEMMRANRVFRVEDINQMSLTDVNPVGPDGYDIFEWRGSYNCRHRWVQLMYESETSIINKSSVRKGLIEEDDMPGPDTLTTSARDAGYAPRVGFNSSNPDVSSLSPYVDQVTKKVVRKPVLAAGLEDACWEGYEPIGLKDDGSPNCVPIKEEMNENGSYVVDEYFSYTDYPQLIKDNAKSALDYIERTGNPNNCMTQVGKVRAQQLAQGKPISIETVKRMKSYIARHKVDLQSSKSYEDGCGKLAMDAWGGVEALPWIEKTINAYENMSSENKNKVLLSLPLFENKEDAEAMAIAIGCSGSHPHTYGDKTLYMPCEKHPDNFATQDELSTFQVFNNEQRLVVGPAMIPDKMIIRRNEITGEIYYVYFTAETIKKLQQKFMIQKLLDKTNVEHGRKFLNDVDVVESWIVDNREKDKQQVFGMDYPEGTWMVTMKVTDDETWKKVKDGELRGFSVQGYFVEKAKFSQINNDLIEEIKNILKQVK